MADIATGHVLTLAFLLQGKATNQEEVNHQMSISVVLGQSTGVQVSIANDLHHLPQENE